ncbi:Proline dehydrogenase 1 [Achromobacter spanius]|uniref:proline dehydrogenase family protein n=1 Tax=Achromobacter spanius TaxID=217203 RepID=UPI000C2C3D8E|nr:proline dehydrogenase family protein [Achromobacter spanius]AUA57303.1 proline dehydrogenase [Achromobacter spanius]CAB3629905.1 Proline dehydrogenase 2 [Achromobacter spanius]SPT38859.1 Proline dehydrogenase 1 [Achromobacter denitrificans]VEE55003.1 Proline dehydrogenase 1 [Achromobacter spanius]
MSIFQRTTIALARSPAMGRAMRAVAARTSLAQRFVGGADVDAAVRTALRLRDAHGIRASLFYLGEYVAEPAAIEHNVSEAIRACGALGAAGLDVHVSVDPTAIGYMASDALGEANARRIGEALRQAAGRKIGQTARQGTGPATGQATGQDTGQAARAGQHWMVLDMEDAGIRERTCVLHRSLLEAGLPAGLTLQARRRRTPEDLAWAIRQHTSLRLVKGAFPERALDHAGRDRIDHAYLDAAAIMLSREAREAGFYPVFGTHDDRLAGAIMALARERGWSPDAFEFEMLYGVRPDWQLALRDLGYNVRVYLPFGGDWWPYAIRRVGENPGNAWLLARSLKADGGYFG